MSERVFHNRRRKLGRCGIGISESSQALESTFLKDEHEEMMT